MMDNTARQLAQPQVAPRPIPAPTPRPNPAAQPAHRVRWSALEWLLTGACGFAMLAFALLMLAGQNQLTTVSHTYQDTQRQIKRLNQEVSDAKQSVGELSNADRLADFAQQNGYTVIEGNIKRVTDK